MAEKQKSRNTPKSERKSGSGLDLLSTSQKLHREAINTCSADLGADIASYFEQSYSEDNTRCENHAPYICYLDSSGLWHLAQGCCNSWQCKRCSGIRARQEYARIVSGAKQLEADGQQLYFVTITCVGKELDLKTADDEYYTWTNRLFSAWRYQARREQKHWAYVQVTERQNRGAAHSHIITTAVPPNPVSYRRGDMLPHGLVAKHECLYSQWFVDANVKAGLGKATDITAVRSAVAVAVYVSKYLFKDIRVTLWPRGWKRIRYSQSWPKLPEKEKGDAFPVVRVADWKRVEALGATVYADSERTKDEAWARLIVNVVYRRKPHEKENHERQQEEYSLPKIQTNEF